MPRTIPLVAEQFDVRVRKVETARVRVRKRVVERLHEAEVGLRNETVMVERVQVNRVFDEPGPARQEGDVLIVPIYEEVLVKRWLLKEELRITRQTHVTQRHIGPQMLRHEEVDITRTPIAAAAGTGDRSD